MSDKTEFIYQIATLISAIVLFFFLRIAVDIRSIRNSIRAMRRDQIEKKKEEEKIGKLG
jgi:hypothetical protein